MSAHHMSVTGDVKPSFFVILGCRVGSWCLHVLIDFLLHLTNQEVGMFMNDDGVYTVLYS